MGCLTLVIGAWLTFTEGNHTKTNELTFASWNIHRLEDDKNNKLTPRVHYRQVVVEAGYTLEQLSGTRELLTGARDVFRGMS